MNNSYDIESGIGKLSINLSSTSLTKSTIPNKTTVNYSDSDPESEEDDNELNDNELNDNELNVHPENIKIHMGTRITLDDTITHTQLNNKKNGLSNNNNIEIDKRSDAGSAHLDEIDFQMMNDKPVLHSNYNNEPIKLKYLFPTLKYKKIKMDKIIEIIDDQFEKDIVTIISNHLDIIASYLSCQKILYMEASHYTSSWLNFLMIPTIIITSTCSVLSGTDLYDYSLLISGLTAFSSLLLAIINYLKLDAASEAHKISSHQYDKLQSQTEFLSGNTLLFSTASFNSHTISNRKKQSFAMNLSRIREIQKKKVR